MKEIGILKEKKKALEYSVADLKCSLACHRNGLLTLQQKIAEDERLLAMFERKNKKKLP